MSTTSRRQRNTLSYMCVCHCYSSVYSLVKFYVYMRAKPVFRYNIVIVFYKINYNFIKNDLIFTNIHNRNFFFEHLIYLK